MHKPTWTASGRYRVFLVPALAGVFSVASLAYGNVFPAALFVVAAAARLGGRWLGLTLTLCAMAPGLVGRATGATPSPPRYDAVDALNFGLVGLVVTGLAVPRRPGRRTYSGADRAVEPPRFRSASLEGPTVGHQESDKGDDVSSAAAAMGPHGAGCTDGPTVRGGDDPNPRPIPAASDGPSDAAASAPVAGLPGRPEGERDRSTAAGHADQGAIRSGERRYRLLAGMVPQIIWMADADGRGLYFNPRWSRYTGLDNPVGQTLGWLSALHPDDLPRFREYWDRARLIGQGFTLDLRLRRSDGTYRWHLLQLLATRSRSGRGVRWLGTFTDIDAQKWAEGALAFLADASALLSSSLDYQTTLSRLAELIAPAVADLCQIDLIEDDGETIRRVSYPRTDSDEPGQPLRTEHYRFDPRGDHPAARVLRSGRTEWANRDAAAGAGGPGAWRAFGAAAVRSYVCVPLESRGRTFGAITLAMARSARYYGPPDVSLAEQLARRAAVAIDNARLYRVAERARLRAEEADRAKDRFLAVLSHELRTPLTPVLMAASALLDDPGTPESVRSVLEMTRRNVELEARLIDDLLDLSRVKAGKLSVAKQRADAHALIWEALDTCRGGAHGNGLDLEVDLGAAEHHVLADPSRLQQVLLNLLRNAVKFTPRGGRIVVRTSNEPPALGDPPGGRLTVEVEDTGVGLAAADLARVFDAFVQGENAAGAGRGGLGLGLAISRAVVEAHGGELFATSPGPGQGSTFGLVLPTVSAGTVEGPKPEEGLSGGPLRILLVEDHPDTLKNLTHVLELRGHTVVAAASLTDALKAAAMKNFDLLVSDIQLPDGSGLDLMRSVGGPGGPTGIALSGYGTDEDVRQSEEAGFFEHLTKPVTFAALEAAIRRATAATSA